MEGRRRLAKRVSTGLTAAAQGRRFGLTVGLAFAALDALLWWRDKPTLAIIVAALAGFLVLGGLVAPARLEPVERLWMGFARRISKITTPILMGVVYFLVITPIGLVVRLRGRNPLTPSESRGGFWISRKADANRRGSMYNQF